MLEYRKSRSVHNRSISVVYDTIVSTIPWIVARFPWYFRRHCWEKVEHCPRYYGVVIPRHVRCYDNNCHTNPWNVKYPIWLITIAVISRGVYTLNRFSIVMVNVLASSECCISWDWVRVDYEIGVYYFSAKHGALSRKSTDVLARSDMSNTDCCFIELAPYNFN